MLCKKLGLFFCETILPFVEYSLGYKNGVSRESWFFYFTVDSLGIYLFITYPKIFCRENWRQPDIGGDGEVRLNFWAGWMSWREVDVVCLLFVWLFVLLFVHCCCCPSLVLYFLSCLLWSLRFSTQNRLQWWDIIIVLLKNTPCLICTCGVG